MSEEADGPERLSTDELVGVIDAIAAGRGADLVPEREPAGDSYWPADHYPPKPALDAILARVRQEQSEVDTLLRTGEPVFVITAGGTRRVHRPECHHVRHTVDREVAWGTVLDGYDALRPSDLSLIYRMPSILTRPQVEALNSYIACQACAPDLDHQRKKFVFPVRPMSALSFGQHHVGRRVFTVEGDDLGPLVSHQRIVTADGVRSITTTTEHVIGGDGTEKYLVAPKDDA